MSSVSQISDTTDDATLLLGVSSGSAESFEQLVRSHHVAVRSCLGRYVREHSLVDDLGQEVFVRAYEQIVAGEPVEQLRPWLMGVARNVAREHVRSEIRRRAREQSPLQVQLARWRLERLNATEEDDMVREKTLAALRDCLDRLAPQSRAVVERHYFEQVTAESIAREQGRKPSAVRMMLLRIRKTLRKCLNGHSVDDSTFRTG